MPKFILKLSKLIKKHNIDPDVALKYLQQEGFNFKGINDNVLYTQIKVVKKKLEYFIKDQDRIKELFNHDFKKPWTDTQKKEDHISINQALSSKKFFNKILHKPQYEKKPRKEKYCIPVIGLTQDLIYLTPNDVKEIHWILVADYAKSHDPIDPPGVKDEALLDSAINRQRTSLGDVIKYPTVAMAGASLLFGIIQDHPFHNGNKRTGFVSLLSLLDKNNWVFCLNDENIIYDYLLTLTQHKLKKQDGTYLCKADEEVLSIAGWIQGNIRKIQKREYILHFNQLRSILAQYGCSFEHPGKGNRINIYRGKLKTQVYYEKEGADVNLNTTHKIRKDLQLDEVHGYDSDIFYNIGPRVQGFIQKYRKVLNKLAKV